MIQCHSCKQWYHENCLHSLNTGRLLCGDLFFILYCASCRREGELILRIEMTLLEAVMLVLYNIQLHYSNEEQEGNVKFFGFEHSIFPHCTSILPELLTMQKK